MSQSPKSSLSMKELQTNNNNYAGANPDIFSQYVWRRGITNQLAGKWKQYYEDYPKIENLNPDGSLQALS